MLVMSAKDINKSYGTDVILEDVSFPPTKGTGSDRRTKRGG